MARLPAIAICDDDAKANQQTLQLIQYYEQLYPENQSVVYQFYSAQELLANEEQINLLFLDIELGGASGVELVPVMKEKFPGITIIFVSSHTKYFIHTTRLGVFQFLTMPLDQMIFFEELDRFFYRCYQNQLLYTLENKEGIFQFPVMEVMYISSSIHQLVVHHIAGAHKKRGQLGSEEKRLQQLGFIRCHQSYLVNPRYIKEIRNYTIFLRNPVNGAVEELPVSKNRAQQTRALYYNWRMQQEESL